ncbi:MAG: hypothetical protein LBR36_02660 [Bacteroidales bacterium]|jgi:hypothetical protein|nr:hypothetical protein [Bacteroidales bacterium]
MFFWKKRRIYGNKKKYAEIEKIIKDKIATSPELWHYYQLSCLSAIQGDTLTPFEYLYQYIDFQEFGEDILTDTDFELLYTTRQWKMLQDSIYSAYLKKYPNISNKTLSLRLWLYGIEDQKYRTLSNNFKKWRYQGYDKKETAQISEQKRIEMINFVDSLLGKKIFPTYSMVGKEASDAVALIANHSSNKKLTNKALSLMEIATKHNEADVSLYATLKDNSLLYQRKKQIYGTQLIRRFKPQANGKSVPCSDYFFAPIEDEKNVNIRRKELGMSTIEEYAQQFGVTYTYNSQNDKMTFKQILKRNNEMAMKQCDEK